MSPYQLWNWFDQRLESWRIRFVAGSILAISLILAVVSFGSADRNQTVFGPALGADFAGFYTAGIILNRYPAERLYDSQLHDELYHELLPNENLNEKLPFVHPPFVALPFRLLALLPYPRSFALWLLITAGLYSSGLAIVARSLQVLPSRGWAIAVLLALSFEPFIMECWLGGQLSPFGFFCLALALACEQRGRCFLAGLALGLCLYKPTLLLLVVPMLFVARRRQALLGLLVTACGLALVSLAAVGWECCTDFVQTLVGFAGSTAGNGLQLRTWKYVDLNSFLRLLLGGHPWANRILLVLLAAVPVLWLIRTWWRWPGLSPWQQRLAWAATLIGTPVFNVYVGVYDSILCVLGVLLTADVLARDKQKDGPLFTPGFRFLLFLLYLTPWLSQPLARLVHVQPDTIVLAAAAMYPLFLLGREDDKVTR